MYERYRKVTNAFWCLLMSSMYDQGGDLYIEKGQRTGLTGPVHSPLSVRSAARDKLIYVRTVSLEKTKLLHSRVMVQLSNPRFFVMHFASIYRLRRCFFKRGTHHLGPS